MATGDKVVNLDVLKDVYDKKIAVNGTALQKAAVINSVFGTVYGATQYPDDEGAEYTKSVDAFGNYDFKFKKARGYAYMTAYIGKYDEMKKSRVQIRVENTGENTGYLMVQLAASRDWSGHTKTIKSGANIAPGESFMILLVPEELDDSEFETKNMNLIFRAADNKDNDGLERSYRVNIVMNAPEMYGAVNARQAGHADLADELYVRARKVGYFNFALGKQINTNTGVLVDNAKYVTCPDYIFAKAGSTVDVDDGSTYAFNLARYTYDPSEQAYTMDEYKGINTAGPYVVQADTLIRFGIRNKGDSAPNPSDITLANHLVLNIIQDSVSDHIHDTDDYAEETRGMLNDYINAHNYITCWGDSLTAMGGWTTRLQTLSGMTVYNGGTGGEKSDTICARQGGDVMEINGITIPASGAVEIASMTDSVGGIPTHFGETVKPLLQTGAHVNPCVIGNVKGTLSWSGTARETASSSSPWVTGKWYFTRSAAGDAVEITRPTAIRTDFDINKNAPHLMIILMGQNGGFSDLDELVLQHKRMIEHSHAKNYLILGMHSGTASSRETYETRMKAEFGRNFLSLREYLSHPIYGEDNETITSCWGMADQNVEIDPEYEYDDKTTAEEIALGMTPHQILADSVHFTSGTQQVIGDLIYRYCRDLNIF